MTNVQWVYVLILIFINSYGTDSAFQFSVSQKHPSSYGESSSGHPLLNSHFEAPQSYSSHISGSGAPGLNEDGFRFNSPPFGLKNTGSSFFSTPSKEPLVDASGAPFQSRPNYGTRHRFNLPPGGQSLIIDDGQTLSGFDDNYFDGLGSSPLFDQSQCRRQTRKCIDSPYRTADGSCNNLRNPEWGMSGTPYGRLLPPKYSDGVHAPPISITGNALPEPRVLSRALLPVMMRDDKALTLAAMQWGQIVTHDMSLGMDTLPNAAVPECCNPRQGPLFDRLSKGEPCYPIVVSSDDPLFKKYRQTCMEFLRTTTDRQMGCASGPHSKPLSAATHWLDGSTVYGDNEAATRGLRAGRGGRLSVEIRNGKAWPPTEFNSTLTCVRPAPEQVCYKTGDVRVNQSPQLALIQILLLREHNRIAVALAELNPHWDDERLFQETRRIVIAEIQHITYFEWLPIFIGAKEFLDDYDPTVEPSVLNEHAQGAFRYFHTNIQGDLLLMSERRFSDGNLRLSEHMQDVSILEAGAFDHLTRGLTTQAQHKRDNFHTHEIIEKLFRGPRNPSFGFDLKSLDIQRGRDHGLASYNDYRQLCGLQRAERFEDFADVIEIDNVRRLQNLYEHPDDVDLAIGGTLEVDKQGSVGPTFACILKEQFRRTRVADRYFFDRNTYKGAFTPEQLIEIRKSNFARLACDHSDKVYTMQPSAFRQLSKQNPLVPCDDFESIPIVDLSAWKEIRASPFSESFK